MESNGAHSGSTGEAEEGGVGEAGSREDDGSKVASASVAEDAIGGSGGGQRAVALPRWVPPCFQSLIHSDM